MKKTVLSFLLFSGLMLGQRPFGPPPGGGRGMAPDATRHVQMLTDRFTLTADQQKQATSIFTNEQNAAATIRNSAQTAHASLAAAIKRNDTGLIDQLSAQLGTYEGQLLALQSKAQAAFYTILTPEQQSKFDQRPSGPRPQNAHRPRPQ